MITVFTPTYNRAGRLPKLYESLITQSFKDFEWLIVDDGSTDGTHDLVDNWIKEDVLRIRFFYQINGGKHRAINYGATMAKGDWFFIVDSDDTLPENALAIASKWIDTIKNDHTFAGVCGIKKDVSGNVASQINFDSLDMSPLRISEISGEDKAEIIKTTILREYPFPDVPGEMFCAEGLMWNRIGLRYKLRYFNEIIYHYEYLEDGLSKCSLRNRRKSPTYASMNYKEQMAYFASRKLKIRAAINYWRFVWLTKDYPKFSGIPFWAGLLLPVGSLISLKDSLTLRK